MRRLTRRQVLGFALGTSVFAIAGASCGDDEGASASSSGGKSTGGTDGGPEPVVAGPPTKYAAFREEIAGSYTVNANQTYGLSAQSYTTVGPFDDSSTAERTAREWGYQEGYIVNLNPDGLLAGVLQGRYYVTQEVHLFSQASGAKDAFERYRKQHDKAPNSKKVSMKGLGNDWGAWEMLKGVVGTSEVMGVYHRVIVRRGNMIGVVQTFGAQPYMTLDQARDIAVIIDERALGNRQAAEPTPAGTPGAR